MLVVAKPYWNIRVSVGGSDAKEVRLTIKGIGGVLDIVHTKDTQTKGKYFILVANLPKLKLQLAAYSVH